MSRDHRLHDYVDDTGAGHDRAEDPVGGTGHYGEPAEPELVEDVDDQDDDEPCVQCGAPDAVQNPQEFINDSLPPEPRCRVCLTDHL